MRASSSSAGLVLGFALHLAVTTARTGARGYASRGRPSHLRTIAARALPPCLPPRDRLPRSRQRQQQQEGQQQRRPLFPSRPPVTRLSLRPSCHASSPPSSSRQRDEAEWLDGSGSGFQAVGRRPTVGLVGRPNVGKSSLFNKIVGERMAVVDNRAGTTRDRLFAPVEWKNASFDLVDSGGIDWGEEAYEDDIDVAHTHARARRRPASGAKGNSKRRAGAGGARRGLDSHGRPGSREFIREIREQALIAMEMSDLVLLVVDAGRGLLEADRQVADLLRGVDRRRRREEKPPAGPTEEADGGLDGEGEAESEAEAKAEGELQPHPPRVVIVVNKADNENVRMEAAEFWSLGFGEPLVVSAKHNTGIDQLLEAIAQNIPPVRDASLLYGREDTDVSVALVGRPNVGKSSLVNAILGSERAIVSNVAGTTRDALDTPVLFDAEGDEVATLVNLIDTAGIIKEKKISEQVDRWSIMRTMRSITRAEVAVMVVDGTQSFSPQDAQIANMVLDRGCSLILAVNKWDAVPLDTFDGVRRKVYTKDEYTDWVTHRFPELAKYVPVVFTSARESKGVRRLMPLAVKVHKERRKVIPTSVLTRVIEEYTDECRGLAKTSKDGKKRLSFLFAVQTSNSPPSFEIRFNDASLTTSEFLSGLRIMRMNS